MALIKKINRNSIFFMAATLAMAAMIWFGASSSIEYTPNLNYDPDVEYVPGRVLEVLADETAINAYGVRTGYQQIRVEILRGRNKGEIIDVTNRLYMENAVDAKVGQRLNIYLYQPSEGGAPIAVVQSYERATPIYAVLGIFVLALALIGRKTGLRSAFGLVFTFVVIIFLLIPLIVKGGPPILLTVGLVIVIAAISLISILGFSKKTLACIISTGIGVVMCCLFYYVFSSILHITGYNTNEIDSLLVIMQNSNINVHQVTVTGLKPSTTYDYVIIMGVETSDALSFTTGDTSNFSFFALGDIQIGADGSNNNRAWQAANWRVALETMTTNFPKASFIASAGDQIETSFSSANATNVELAQNEYNLLLDNNLAGLPIAPSVGNHDVNTLFRDHYTIPSGDNLEQHNTGATQFDYWFRYGNTLFIVLDSNTTSAASAASRTPFFENAVQENEDANWKVVMFHHPPYSAYRLESDASKTGMRENWSPIFEANGIDVVLTGHCHSYNRTYQMLGDVPQKEQTWIDASGNIRTDATGLLYNTVLDPTGIVYFAFNATAGSKFYDVHDDSAHR